MEEPSGQTPLKTRIEIIIDERMKVIKLVKERGSKIWGVVKELEYVSMRRSIGNSNSFCAK